MLLAKKTVDDDGICQEVSKRASLSPCADGRKFMFHLSDCVLMMNEKLAVTIVLLSLVFADPAVNLYAFQAGCTMRAGCVASRFHHRRKFASFKAFPNMLQWHLATCIVRDAS